MPIPAEPIVFMKATTCISGPNDDVMQPKRSTRRDWEVELGVVIGTPAQYVGRPRRWSTSRAIASSTTSPNGRSRWHRGNGTRARAATPPARSGHGW